MLGTFQKQPADVLDYDIDLRDWLEDTDDVIEGATVTISPEDELKEKSTRIYAQYLKLWLEGGEDRKDYRVTVLIKTAEGRTKEVDFRMRVNDR